jgi:RNA polymerase sigma factor (sigma-70 family)
MGAMAEAIDRDLGGIVEAAADGDELAFARIVAAYHAEMLRICVVISRDQAIAEEAVQSAWSIAWHKLDSVREADRIRPWLIAIAVNEARQLLRKRRRRSEVEVAVAVDASFQPGGIDPATGIGYVDMQDALERFEPEDRALLALRYVAGFDATELSKAIGLSPAGTRTRLKRLLDRLRQELQ